MSLTTSEMTPADIAAVTGNNRNDGFGFGGDGAWWIVILFLFAFCGWGGGFGGFGGGGATTTSATQADIQRGFDNQGVMNKLNGIEQGICSLGYDQLNQMNGINANITQTGFGIQNAIQQSTVAGMQNANAIQTQLADCCCTTQRAIDGVNYNMATQACDTRNTIQNSARDIIDNQNGNARAILDALTAQRIEAKDEKIAELQSLVNSLNLAQSQANQNNYLVNTLRPCPTPAYITCNPWASQAAYGSCNTYACAA